MSASISRRSGNRSRASVRRSISSASTVSVSAASRLPRPGPEMAARVITVARPAPGLARRKLWTSLFVGLAVVTAHLIRNLLKFASGGQDFTIHYPEQRLLQPPALRGMPVLVQMENGKERCVACGLCEWACPTSCITIFPGETANEVERYPQ